MRRAGRLLVGLTAVATIAMSSAMGLTLWRLWRQPIRLDVERVSDGLKWRCGALELELTAHDGRFEQLVVWRGAEDWP